VKRLIKLLLARFPSKLPIGVTEQARWASDIIYLAGPGIPDNSSTRFALAVMVLHLGSTQSRKPKLFFARQLFKAAANEIAHGVAQQYKEKQKREEEDAKKAEAVV
jgi:hypothetical protein